MLRKKGHIEFEDPHHVPEYLNKMSIVISESSFSSLKRLIYGGTMQARREGGTTGTFSRGPQPWGGPWGPIGRKEFFFYRNKRKKSKI